MSVPQDSLGTRLRNLTARIRALSGWEAARLLDRLAEARGAERWQIAAHLGSLPLRSSHIRRIVHLLDTPDALLRWILEDTLIAAGASNVAGPCLERLRAGGDRGGVIGCIRVLAASQAPGALEGILAHCSHPDVHVRVAVADALGPFLEDRRGQEALLALLEDEAAPVRRAAVWTLRRGNGPWAQAVLAAHARQHRDPWCKDVEGKKQEPS